MICLTLTNTGEFWMEERYGRQERPITAKMTIALNRYTYRLQKGAYEKIIYRNRYKYRTQSEYILAAVLQYEDPEYPICHLAEADRELLIKEIRGNFWNI